VSRADEIGGRRRLSLAIVVRLYEPAGKAASRGQRPGLRVRPAAEEPAPGGATASAGPATTGKKNITSPAKTKLRFTTKT